MTKRILPVLLVAVAAVGVSFALGLLDGGDEAPDAGGPFRTGEAPKNGPTGPTRRHDVEAGDGSGDVTLVGVPGARVPLPVPSARDVGEVVVKVVDAAGVPLANQWVSVFVDGKLRETVVTGRDGKVTLEDLPRNGGAYLALGRAATQPEAVVAVRGATASLKAATVLQLRVDLVDAESSAPLGHARWYFSTPVLAGTTEPIPSGVTTPVKSTPGRQLVRPYAATPTPDYVDWDPAWSTYVSRYATSLVAIHPLRREVDVTVSLHDKEKEPVRDAQVNSWHTARVTESSPETGLYLLGGLPLGGVPYHRGEALVVWASNPGGLLGRSQALLPDDPHEEVEIEIVLGKGPPHARKIFEERRFEVDDDALPVEESLQPLEGGPATLSGGIRVVVRRADGRPAVGALVRLPVEGEHRADGEGVLEVNGVLAGAYVVRVDEPGIVPVEAKVDVRGESVTDVTLQEPWGATLEVEVKGADGTPLPYARLEIVQHSRTAWVDLDDDLQRLDPYTDHQGRRMLRRLQPGPVLLRARWASRIGETTVHVGNRETKQVTLLLR